MAISLPSPPCFKGEKKRRKESQAWIIKLIYFMESGTAGSGGDTKATISLLLNLAG